MLCKSTVFSRSIWVRVVCSVGRLAPALATGLAFFFLFLVAFAGVGFASTLTALKARSKKVEGT